MWFLYAIQTIVVSIHPSLQKLRTNMVQAAARLCVSVRVWQWLARLAWAGCFLLVLALGLTQWVVFPWLAAQKGELEQTVSTALGQPVRIGAVTPHWRGIHPGVVLDDLRLTDAAGQETLHLQQVSAFLAWRTLWRWEPIFDLLLVESPVLHMQRNVQGQIRVAGFLTEGETDPRTLDWLLAQRRVRIQHATVIWDDQQRQAPILTLNDLNFGLDNTGGVHRFGLTAQPPKALAGRLDLRGEWTGRVSDGEGRLFAELAAADLVAWQRWVDAPVSLSAGRGGLRVWAQQSGAKREVTLDVGLSKVQVRFDPSLPMLAVKQMQGRIKVGVNGETLMLAAQNLGLTLQDGLDLPSLQFDARWQAQENGGSLFLNANEIDMDRLRRLATYFPVPQGLRSVLAEYAPTGRLKQVESRWQVEGEHLPAYRLKATLEDVGLAEVGIWPGVRHLSGQVDGSEDGGKLTIDSHQFELHWPSIFPETQQFAQLRGKSSWTRSGLNWHLDIAQLYFANADLSGQMSGQYDHQTDGPQVLDVDAQISRGVVRNAWRYVPAVAGSETRQWLKSALQGGKLSDARVTIHGDVRQFPFSGGQEGIFRVTGRVSEGRLVYDPAWPEINGISATLEFDRQSMAILASEALTAGARLSGVQVRLPDLLNLNEPLSIEGDASADTGRLLEFVEHSPVAAWIGHVTTGMKGSGEGRLHLALRLPLERLETAQVQGVLDFSKNTVQPLDFLPSAQDVSGQIRFSEAALEKLSLQGLWLGSPVRVQGSDGPDGLRVVATGYLGMRELSAAWASETDLQPYLAGLSGRAEWRAEIEQPLKAPPGSGPGLRWRINSDLLGLASSLPGPLNKSASQRLPFSLVATPQPLVRGVRRGGPPIQREQWMLKMGPAVNAQWQFQVARQGLQFERGWLALGLSRPRLPANGMLLALKWPELRAEDWAPLLNEGVGNARALLPSPSLLSLETDRLRVMGRALERLNVQGVLREGDWLLNLESPQVAGTARWRAAGKGSIQADLKRLRLPPAQGTDASEGGADTLEVVQSLPSLDIKIADLTLGSSILGQVELKAESDANGWRLPQLRIVNGDTVLTGQVAWQTGSRNSRNPIPEKTDLTFQLNTGDVGRLLDRMGYVGMVRHGSGKLGGHLSWANRPTRFDPGSLSGDLSIHVQDGQFAKIEPGAGKLLGLLSLQNLPRRLLLDFKDVFNDGFAFDRIEGDTVLQAGVMRTREPLRIEGASAQVLMQGEVNLRDETQNLKLTVRPGLSGVASLGAAVVNPVVGLTALLAQKLLQNPLDKVFSVQYKVTGSWADPQVNKVE